MEAEPKRTSASARAATTTTKFVRTLTNATTFTRATLQQSAAGPLHIRRRCFVTAARIMLQRKVTPVVSTLDQDSSQALIAWWVPVLGGFVMTIVGGLGYFYDQVGSFEGLRRTIYFYSFAIPKYVEYRYHLWANSPQEVWDELDRTTSATALQKVFDLEGFYIKVRMFEHIFEWEIFLSCFRDSSISSSPSLISNIHLRACLDACV